MIKFTTILHDKRKELDISMLEYVLLDTIEKLSKPKFRAHRKTLAEFVGMSRVGLIKALNRLVEKGLLIRVNDKELAVTQKWIDETIISVNKVDGGVNKVYSKCKQSIQPTTNRIKELELKNKNIQKDCDIFEIFRSAYPGSKLGNKTEFDNFKKRHKDWKEVLPDLTALLRCQANEREVLSQAKQFVPHWKNLQTWINQRCWEQEQAVHEKEPSFKDNCKYISADDIYANKETMTVYDSAGNISNEYKYEKMGSVTAVIPI